MSKEYYKRKLPHIQPEGATFFVTFRLFDSIPYTALQKLKQECEVRRSRIISTKNNYTEQILLDEKERYFSEYDSLLDSIQEGPKHLSISQVANIVSQELHHFNGEYYDLVCFCIMSNHVHILIDTSIQLPKEDIMKSDSYIQLDQIMKKIKGRSAMKANKAIGRTGKFWEPENFDTYIRNDNHLNNVINYILMNPVNAGLTKNWKDWNFTYFKYREDD